MKVLHGTLIAAAILTAASVPAALAQAPANHPAFVVTYIEVAPSGGTEATDLLKQVADTERLRVEFALEDGEASRLEEPFEKPEELGVRLVF